MQASTSSPLMTGLRFMIWFRTMKNTTKLTAKTIVTARVTTALGTAVSKDPPTIAKVNALRNRQKRNFLSTLFLSQGIPMLLGGDEIGRTQRGNNNAYCQDNEISWYDWSSADTLLEFARWLIQLRKEHPVFTAQVVSRPPHSRRKRHEHRLVHPCGSRAVRWPRRAENITGDRC